MLTEAVAFSLQHMLFSAKSAIHDPRDPHTHVETMPKMLVMLSKMPVLCLMLSHANYAQNYARLIGAALLLLKSRYSHAALTEYAMFKRNRKQKGRENVVPMKLLRRGW